MGLEDARRKKEFNLGTAYVRCDPKNSKTAHEHGSRQAPVGRLVVVEQVGKELCSLNTK